MASAQEPAGHPQQKTRVLSVDASKIGHLVFNSSQGSFLRGWDIQLSESNPDAVHLKEAASRLRSSNVPVAFPTETVYGLGADATRSAAVRGIYSAKGRPSDNPLIVHVSSLSQLDRLFAPANPPNSNLDPFSGSIPKIYDPLISRFWPGPLTILLPLPTPSPLAPEVTASLPTVAVRMPSSVLALALIQLAGVPVAAPSANASSKPSPTTAAHVLHDLSGRIELILDGGPCTVGVESTVVDGLSSPPVILRPGGVSIDVLRSCPGWENVRVAYKDGAEADVPRAPGMKYKHYSPNARVLLFHGELNAVNAKKYLGTTKNIGVLTTKTWQEDVLQKTLSISGKAFVSGMNGHMPDRYHLDRPELVETTQPLTSISVPPLRYSKVRLSNESEQDTLEVWTIGLGQDTADIARGLFSALRELDQKGVDIMFVEGIDDTEGDAAAAVMNRLRKAAEAEIIL